MKNSLIFLFAACSLVFNACGYEKEQDSPQEIESAETTAVMQSQKTSVSQTIELRTGYDRAQFQKAIKGAVKIDGAVNMAAPHYKIIDGEKRYFLWLNKDGSATLMNASDTHAIYEMDESSNINELVTKD